MTLLTTLRDLDESRDFKENHMERHYLICFAAKYYV